MNSNDDSISSIDIESNQTIKKRQINQIKNEQNKNQKNGCEIQSNLGFQNGVSYEQQQQQSSIQIQKSPSISQKLEQFQAQTQSMESSEFLYQEPKLVEYGYLEDKQQQTLLNSDQMILKNGKHINQNYIDTIINRLSQQNFTLIAYLTSGGEGDIFIATKKDEKEIILKIYSGIDFEQFQKEVNIIQSINKPIFSLGIDETIIINEIQVFIIVQQKCQFSLQDELYQYNPHKKKDQTEEQYKQFLQNKPPFQLIELLNMIFDSINGLIEIRSHNILHQDIKPGNILKNISGYYVISDYGCASICQDNKTQYIGCTLPFASPEQIKQYIRCTLPFGSPEQIKKEDLSFKSDVYSLGKTLIQVIECYQSNQGQQADSVLIKQFLEIINKSMLVENHVDREDIMNILTAFFYLVNKNNFIEFNKVYAKKFEEIISQFPYDNSKNVKYYSQIYVLYSLMYFHTLLVQKNYRKQLSIYDKIESTYRIDGISKKIQDQGICNALDKIGDEYQELGKYDFAFKYKLESLKMRKIMLPKNHPKTFESLGNVVCCYLNLNHIKGKGYFLGFLCLIKLQINMDDLTRAKTLDLMRKYYYSFGDYEKAFQCSVYSLNIYLTIYPEDHTQIAQSLSNLGDCYEILNNFQEAYIQKQKCLGILKRIIKDKNHSRIADALNQLGSLELKRGNYNQALQYYSESQKILEILFSSNHPKIADVLNKIGTCLLELGQYENSYKKIEQSIDIYIRINIQKSMIGYAESLENLGNFCEMTGEKKKAYKYFDQYIIKIQEIF